MGSYHFLFTLNLFSRRVQLALTESGTQRTFFFCTVLSIRNLVQTLKALVKLFGNSLAKVSSEFFFGLLNLIWIRVIIIFLRPKGSSS